MGSTIGITIITLENIAIGEDITIGEGIMIGTSRPTATGSIPTVIAATHTTDLSFMVTLPQTSFFTIPGK